jgi:hypothetical protein
MSTHYGKTVEYHCLNDCRQEGCPGHQLRFVFNGTSDTYSVEIDGTEMFFFDEHQFHAMMKSFHGA